MSHLRMGGILRRIMGGLQGNPHSQQFPGWVQYPETPDGRAVLPSSSSGSGPGQTSLEGNPLVTPPIGINAPFGA
jgi:hypothetical protein